MDFQPTLQRNLNALGSVLSSRPGGWVLTRKSRLPKLRHMRVALNRWRALRNVMELAGLPPCPAKLRVHEAPASYCWDASKGARIYLPATIKAMPRPVSTNPTVRNVDLNFEALVLLHEWGHSLLHPPSDISWLEHLYGPARVHAHPGFAHVGEYAEWRVFNEMFADAFSAAWMLRLFNRSPSVVSTLRDLRNHRRETAKNFNTVDFPCYHHTSSVLSEVMRQHWDGNVEDIVPRLVRICSQHFAYWFNEGPLPGKQICQSSEKHLKILDRDFRHEATRTVAAPPD